MSAPPHVYLIDGSAYVWRAFHSQGNTVRFHDNMPVGAVKGFCDMLWRLLTTRIAGEKPTHVGVVFDHVRSRSFRTDIHPAYKGNRPPPPDDIRHQFALCRKAVRAFDIVAIEQPDVEADDLIATYATWAVREGGTVVIVSGDKDFYQLVSDEVMIWDPWWIPPEVRKAIRDQKTIPQHDTGRVVGEYEVRLRFGVPPRQVADVQALAGDVADHVPGIKGIGEKIAAELIIQHGSLNRVFELADLIPQNARRKRIIEGENDARLSLKLVTLQRDIDAHMPLDELTRFDFDEDGRERLFGFLKAMSLYPLATRIAEQMGVPLEPYEADRALSQPGAGTGWKFRHQ